MALETIRLLSLRAKRKTPLLLTTPEPSVPVLPPLPIWSVPAVIDVPPGYEFDPVRISNPFPSLLIWDVVSVLAVIRLPEIRA